MAAYIHRHRQPRNVCGGLLNVYRKAGLSAAKALRPYPQTVYPFKHLCLQLCV